MIDPTVNVNRYATNNEIRWCPGCGNYALLKGLQRALNDAGLDNDKIVFVSGIGCSGRFPFYLNTHGFHTIHGRAIPIATGIKIARPDLTVFVVTGDGDSMSIGLNHLLHAIRRDIDIKILLVNNRVYGLTKGQVSPTTVNGDSVKNNNTISQEHFEPLMLAEAAGAKFLARVADIDEEGIVEVVASAIEHTGCSLIEVYQNCNIYNDGAFGSLRSKVKNNSEKIWLVNDGKDKRKLPVGESCTDMKKPVQFGVIKREINQ
jgi:2-oxoglutarate ferredoxin oxidoreductase subunit beta